MKEHLRLSAGLGWTDSKARLSWALADHAEDKSRGALPHDRARTDPREHTPLKPERAENGTAEGISHISKQNIQECKNETKTTNAIFFSFSFSLEWQYQSTKWFILCKNWTS